MSTPQRPVDYDSIAMRYDDHRGWEQEIPLRLLALATGGAPGTGRAPLLELGCGTGNVTRWLRAHWNGPLAALDLSRGMLAKAQAKLRGVGLFRADARRLPLRDQSVRAALGSFFLHHLDAPGRARLFSELSRVLAVERSTRASHGTRAGIAFLTSSHAQIRACSLARWMPSVPTIDCARFPDLDVLRAELAGAGFAALACETIRRVEPRGDRTFLEKTRARFLSTLDLVPEVEFTRGLAAMEAQLTADGHLGDVSWHATIVHGIAP